MVKQYVEIILLRERYELTFIKFMSEPFKYILFFVGMIFGVPLIIGLCTTIAFLLSLVLGVLIVIGCSPFVFIFLFLFNSLSKYGEAFWLIYFICIILGTIIGFIFGIFTCIDIIKTRYKSLYESWYKSWHE